MNFQLILRTFFILKVLNILTLLFSGGVHLILFKLKSLKRFYLISLNIPFLGSSTQEQFQVQQVQYIFGPLQGARQYIFSQVQGLLSGMCVRSALPPTPRQKEGCFRPQSILYSIYIFYIYIYIHEELFSAGLLVGGEPSGCCNGCLCESCVR